MEKSEQQFYELDDAGQPITASQASQMPTPQPSFRRRWLRYTVVIILLIIVGLLAFFGVKWLLSPAIDELTDEEMSEAYALVKYDLEACDDDENPELCRDRVWINAAQEVDEPSLCIEAISEDLAYNCVFDIAYERLDPDQCALIENEAQKTTCIDTILLEQYVDSLYYGNCKLLNNDTMVSRCKSRIERAIINEGQCEDYGIDVTLCSDEEAIGDALRTGNPNNCDELILRDSKSACMDEFHATDLDADGLTLYDEYYAGTSDNSSDTDGDGLYDGDELSEYGTDPVNADTDGDGYSDGEEVAGGFDPLGLEQSDEE